MSLEIRLSRMLSRGLVSKPYWEWNITRIFGLVFFILDLVFLGSWSNFGWGVSRGGGVAEINDA